MWGVKFFVFFLRFLSGQLTKNWLFFCCFCNWSRAGRRAVWQYSRSSSFFFNNCDFFCVVSKYFCSIVRCLRRDQFQYDHYVINTIEWEKMKNEKKLSITCSRHRNLQNIRILQIFVLIFLMNLQQTIWGKYQIKI